MITLSHYDVIRSPVVTEKSTAATEHNKVIFNVASSASKSDIKAAVEALFKVKVTAVSHPDSIYAGAIGAALWGAFRHQRLNAPAERAAA